MKKRLVSFISAIILLASIFSFSVSAEKISSHNLEFTPPSEFIVLTEENVQNNLAACESLGFTQENFIAYLKNNNILLFASRADKLCQFTITATQTPFSKNVENISYLDNSSITNMIPQFISEGTPLRIETLNNAKYIVVQKNGNDNAGSFVSLQYITVLNSQLYTATISFSGTELSGENAALADTLINSLNITENSKGVTLQGFQSVAIYVGLVAIILFLVVVIVYISYTVVSDVIKNRNTSDVAPYVKIKRRRFK